LAPSAPSDGDGLLEGHPVVWNPAIFMDGKFKLQARATKTRGSAALISGLLVPTKKIRTKYPAA
jgi:hypothetical protein